MKTAPGYVFGTLLAILTSLPVAAHAQGTNYTDLWWNPAESGWGVNMAQNGHFIFATFFVYGPANAPTWYTGQLTRDAAGNFAGPLYATMGPYFGATPFDASRVTIGAVGTATFEPAAADTGRLTYSVGGTAVSKNVQRQTLVPISLAGNYLGTIVHSLSGCANPAQDGTFAVPVAIGVTTPAAGQLRIALEATNGAQCTLAGATTQTGQLLAFQAAYACSSGASTTASVYELKATSTGIEGRWTAMNAGGGCRQEAGFNGIIE